MEPIFNSCLAINVKCLAKFRCAIALFLLANVLFASVAMGQTVYENYTFLSFAGPGEDGPGSFDGSGSAARFSVPAGIARDANGNLYLADSGNNTIRKITPD